MSRERLLAIEAELRTRYINRDDEIHGMLLAALSGQHVVLLGPPGTAKSMMIKDFSECLLAKHFQWLMTKFTTPEEIFGPVDIAALKQGEFRRVVKGKIPEAEVAYLDEVFKANSPILNSLLSVLQERVFYNDSVPIQCPLLFAVGSSNELPDEEEGLAALYDRFLLRYNTGYLRDMSSFTSLMQLQPTSKTVAPIDHTELLSDKAAAMALLPDPEAIESLGIVWSRLKEAGVIASDRRYKQMLQVMAAESWLMGCNTVVAESLLVGVHILWDKPDKERLVNQVVRSSVNPGLAKAQEIEQAAKTAMAELNEGSGHSADEVLQTIRQLKQLRKDLEGFKQSAAIAKVGSKLDEYITNALEKMVGVA